MKGMRHKIVLVSLLSLLAMLLVATEGSATAAEGTGAAGARPSPVSSSSLGTFKPTFAGPAAAGCAIDCSLLSGPLSTPSTASAAKSDLTASGKRSPVLSRPQVLPSPNPQIVRHLSPIVPSRLPATSFPIPSVSCLPLGPGCDSISTSAGGASGVKGLNAVDSARHTTNIFSDVEPPDQGLCAGNGYVVETNNIGEILVFNTALKRVLQRRSRSTRSWGSPAWDGVAAGILPACTTLPTAGTGSTPRSSRRAPRGAAALLPAASQARPTCATKASLITDGPSPFGPYHVYFTSADYNPGEPGYPSLLNDFAKISVTRDAFLMFYDEFPLLSSLPGVGGGFFNGAQELAFDKNALEQGLPARLAKGQPNPAVTVAIENMGHIPTPDGTCARDDSLHEGGITCWTAAIPAQPVAGQFDNSHGGTGFMLDSLDFYGFVPLPTSGDNRIAAWAWTGLSALNTRGCATCAATIRFTGQLFAGVDRYYGPENLASPQKTGPIPLGDECGAAGLSTGSPPPASCPEGGIATNGDFMTQVSQAQGQLWGATNTEVAQTYTRANAEVHQGVVYWVVGTNSFDTTGKFTLTSQGYVTATHEDLEMAAIAATPGPKGRAIMLFTLNGNGGPTGADHGGFFPSTAFGRLTSSSNGLLQFHDQHRGHRQVPPGRVLRVPGLPGRDPPPMGRLQLGDIPAWLRRSDLLRQRVHPVPELHRLGVHADDWDLRRDQGRSRQLGYLGQLCDPVAKSAARMHVAPRGGSRCDIRGRGRSTFPDLVSKRIARQVAARWSDPS